MPFFSLIKLRVCVCWGGGGACVRDCMLGFLEAKKSRDSVRKLMFPYINGHVARVRFSRRNKGVSPYVNGHVVWVCVRRCKVMSGPTPN